MLLRFLADTPASTMTTNTMGKHKYRTPHNTISFYQLKSENEIDFWCAFLSTKFSFYQEPDESTVRASTSRINKRKKYM